MVWSRRNRKIGEKAIKCLFNPLFNWFIIYFYGHCLYWLHEKVIKCYPFKSKTINVITLNTEKLLQWTSIRLNLSFYDFSNACTHEIGLQLIQIEGDCITKSFHLRVTFVLNPDFTITLVRLSLSTHGKRHIFGIKFIISLRFI